MATEPLPPPPAIKGENPYAVAKYTGSKGRMKCADCEQLMYEAMMAGTKVVPSVANVARYLRHISTALQGERSRPICIEHKNMRVSQGK